MPQISPCIEIILRFIFSSYRKGLRPVTYTCPGKGKCKEQA